MRGLSCAMSWVLLVAAAGGCVGAGEQIDPMRGSPVPTSEVERVRNITVGVYEEWAGPITPSAHACLDAVPVWFAGCEDCPSDVRGICRSALGQPYILLLDNWPYDVLINEVLPHEFGHKLHHCAMSGWRDPEHSDSLMWDVVVPKAVEALRQ